MKTLLKKYKYYILIGLFALICVIDNVYAKTIVDFNICEFKETLQLFKLIGIVTILLKIVLPLILMFMCIKEAVKVVINGKQEELTGMFPKFCKRFIAAAVIFFIPGIVNYAVDYLIGFDDSDFKECTICLFEPENCTIPDKNPELYEKDKK